MNEQILTELQELNINVESVLSTINLYGPYLVFTSVMTFSILLFYILMKWVKR